MTQADTEGRRSFAVRRTPRPPLGRRRRLLLLAAGLSLSVLALLWTATRYITAARHRLVVPAVLVPFALLPALAGVALVAASRSRWLALLASLAVVAAVGTQVPLYVGATQPGGGQALTVLTLNMHLGTADAAQVVRAVRDRRVDILAVQEMTEDAKEHLQAADIEQVLPFAVVSPQPDASGVGLWSRYPLGDRQILQGWDNGAVSARVDTGPGRDHPLVLSLHVPAPWPQPAGGWDTQLRVLTQLLVADTGSVVVAGDFNSTLDLNAFRAMLHNGGVSDAGELAGAGWLPTYPADRAFPPIIGIDHVLVRGVSATGVRTLTVSGSDHRALLAALRVR